MPHVPGVPPLGPKRAASKGRITATRSAGAGQLRGAMRLPRPDLGGDVVDHGNPPFVRRRRDAEVEPRVVDGDDEVDLPDASSLPDPALEPQEVRKAGRDLGEPHDGEVVEPGQEFHPLGGHPLAPGPQEPGAGNAPRSARARWAPWRSPEASPASRSRSNRAAPVTSWRAGFPGSSADAALEAGREVPDRRDHQDQQEGQDLGRARGLRTSAPAFFRLRRTCISDMAEDPGFDGEGDLEGGSALDPGDGRGDPSQAASRKESCSRRRGSAGSAWRGIRSMMDERSRARRPAMAASASGPGWKRGEILLEPEELAGARRQVQAQVPGALEDADLPETLQRDTARGEVRHRAPLVGDAGVRDVHGRGQHRGAGGLELLHRATHQAPHEVHVVDHQVEHHRHVRAPLRERGQAVRLDEEGLSR
jgi:hypothetical protein